MSKKSFTKEEAQKELKAVKQSNKTARETRAKRAGFSSAEKYINYLKTVIDLQELPASPISPEEAYKDSTPLTILVVDVLDRSGSMGNRRWESSKIYNAVKGIETSIKGLVKDEKKLGVKYEYILIYFDTSIDIVDKTSVSKAFIPKDVDGRGGTALNDAILKAIEVSLKERSSHMDKILINVYTDGGENASKRRHTDVSKRIAEVEKEGVTVTFIGTKYDTDQAISRYGICESNTVSYDGSAQGLVETMSMTRSARTNYTIAAQAGEDVTKGFYKKFK